MFTPDEDVFAVDTRGFVRIFGHEFHNIDDHQPVDAYRTFYILVKKLDFRKSEVSTGWGSYPPPSNINDIQFKPNIPYPFEFDIFDATDAKPVRMIMLFEESDIVFLPKPASITAGNIYSKGRLNDVSPVTKIWNMSAVEFYCKKSAYWKGKEIFFNLGVVIDGNMHGAGVFVDPKVKNNGEICTPDDEMNGVPGCT
jgi:hypothetical protein